jgi:hypothetical protein
MIDDYKKNFLNPVTTSIESSKLAMQTNYTQI